MFDLNLLGLYKCGHRGENLEAAAAEPPVKILYAHKLIILRNTALKFQAWFQSCW